MAMGFRFYNKREYIHELVHRFESAGAGSRILLMTMVLDPSDPEIMRLLTSLEGAAARGAEIAFSVDAKTFLGKHGQLGPLWFHSEIPGVLSPKYRAARDVIENLNRYDNTVARILNIPAYRYTLPVAGRSHIKAAIVDNYVFVGGCNLDNASNIDFMAGWEDTAASNELWNQLHGAIINGNVRAYLQGADRELRIEQSTTVLIDAGLRNQSIILDHALQLIDSAQEWLTITCQYFPNSTTARHLRDAQQRGVDVTILFAHPKHHGLIGGAGQYFSLGLEHTRLPADMFRHRMSAQNAFLHAKIIACDRGMMIGSHNYVRAGVRLGTAEIALCSSSAELGIVVKNKLYENIDLNF